MSKARPPTVRMWRQGRHCGESAQGLDCGRAQFSRSSLRRRYVGRATGTGARAAAGCDPAGGDCGSGVSRARRGGVQILHRGQAKTLTPRQWRWIKRRQAVEPVIGHLKQDCRLNRCHLKGARGCTARARLRRWLQPALAAALDRMFACLVAGGAGVLLNALKHPVARKHGIWCLRGFSGATRYRPGRPCR